MKYIILDFIGLYYSVNNVFIRTYDREVMCRIYAEFVNRITKKSHKTAAMKRTQFIKQILPATRHARRLRKWRKKSKTRNAKKILNQNINGNCGEKYLGEGQCVAAKSVKEIASVI